jgi:hypothetical protein
LGSDKKNTIMHNHTNFIQAVLTQFPNLGESIAFDGGLPYNEMGTFASFTQEAKNTENWEDYERAVRLVASFLPLADDELRNEIHVSYLEHLDFEEPNGLRTWRLLPTNLQRAWHEIIEYDERLTRQPWVKTKYKVAE